jgi:hypothetical protein
MKLRSGQLIYFLQVKIIFGLLGGRALWQLVAEGRIGELLSEDCENPSPGQSLLVH